MNPINRIHGYCLRFIASKRNATYQRSSYIRRLRSKKRILLYTDSRGINIPGQFDYLHYSTRLLRRYNVDAYLCPEKWTTILDFLKLWKRINPANYDFVILHAGAVDAAPRHQKILLEEIYPAKKEMFDDVFGEKNILSYLKTDLHCDYEGDKTNNMYSLEMAQNQLLPRLLKIPGLIWVGTNKIDTEWRGNYWKDRPDNIKLIEEYSRLFADNLPAIVNLLDLWSVEDVHRYTFDNIHPNKSGSDFIFTILESIIIAT